MRGESPDHTLQPTALVHEAWLRLSGGDRPGFANSAHFFASAAEAMRRILIDNARTKARLKRGQKPGRVDWNVISITTPEPDETLLKVDQALHLLEAKHPGKANLVKMKFFVGMSNREVAGALGVSERTVERDWAYAKAWLFREIRAVS